MSLLQFYSKCCEALSKVFRHLPPKALKPLALPKYYYGETLNLKPERKLRLQSVFAHRHDDEARDGDDDTHRSDDDQP